MQVTLLGLVLTSTKIQIHFEILVYQSPRQISLRVIAMTIEEFAVSDHNHVTDYEYTCIYMYKLLLMNEQYQQDK